MHKESSWDSLYPEAAKNFGEDSIAAGHMAELVSSAALDYGSRPAVSTQLADGACATVDFDELDRLTSDFAVYLREIAAAEQGDVVALMSPNCIDFVVAAFGIFKAGCICTNINPMYTAREIDHQLRDSGAGILVIVDLFGDKADAAIDRTSVRQVVTISLLDFLPAPAKVLRQFVLKRIKKAVPRMRTSHVTMAAALKQGAARRAAGSVNVDAYRSGQSRDDTALYQYTGGTTGRSKGAELSHRNILFNAATATSMVEEFRDSENGDCALVVLPLYHITAFALIMAPSLMTGAHGVMVPSPRPPSNLKPAFENHPVTHFAGINALYAALLNEPWCTPEVLAHLKFCSSGGAAQLVDVARRWEDLTGLPIHQGYGLTEGAGVLTMSPAGDNRLGYAGIPVPGIDVRIVGSDGAEMPRGEPGEVVARGPTVMKGYLNNPEATAETIRNGWLHTGDVGVMDDDGFVQIVDRKKDMILVSGFNVYPNEIEEVIVELAGVIEVGVVGVPDEKTGEAVKAFVVSSDPALTADTVKAHCRESLTNYKRPKFVEFVPELPKSPVGKVLRRNLRDLDAG